MIPEDDQIFTDVELNLLEKVINETTVGSVSFPSLYCSWSRAPVSDWLGSDTGSQQKKEVSGWCETPESP